MENIIRAAPVLFTKDINASIAFYEDALGFVCVFREAHERHPLYAVLIRDGVEVHLSRSHPEWAGRGVSAPGFCNTPGNSRDSRCGAKSIRHQYRNPFSGQ